MQPVTSLGAFDIGLSALVGLNALVVTCLICWGVWGIFDKKALAKASERDVFLAMVLLELPQVPIVFLILNHSFPGWTVSPQLWLFGALSAVLYSVSMASYLAALSRTEASYVLGFTAGYPLVTQILAVAILGESLVMSRLLGGALIALGVFSIGASHNEHAGAMPKSEEKTSSVRDWRQRLLVPACVVIATLCWGIKGLVDKLAVSLGRPLEVYFVEIVANSLVIVPLLAYFIALRHRPELKSISVWIYCALSTLALAFGTFAYLAALTLATASYVITITGCYPLLMYLLTLVFLKEKLNKVRVLGIVLVVLGGIVVQLTQG